MLRAPFDSTVTVTCPLPAGAIAFSEVGVMLVAGTAGAAPKRTVLFGVKPTPVIVTVVPAAPPVGESAVSLGATVSVAVRAP